MDSILARHMEALGGRERLISINSISAQGSVTVNGIEGHQVSYQKYPFKFLARFDLGPMSQTIGSDGLVDWQQDGNGIARTQSAEERKPLFNEMYFQTYSYLLKTVHTGRVEYHGISVIDDESFYQLLLFPDGGDSLYILIDKETDLVRYRMENSFGISMVTKYEDYRDVEGLMVPFFSSSTATNAPMSMFGQISSVEINPELDDSLFVMPGQSREDFAFPNETDSIIIPFQLDNNHIYLKIKVNGQGTFKFLLDSGAGGIVISQKVADQLELKRLGDLPARGLGGFGSFGLTQIDSLNISTLSLYTKNVMIGDLEVGGGDKRWSIDGILGYDLFARFPISIDFDRGEIIIFKPTHGRSKPDGIQLEIEIFNQLPIVSVKLDSYALRPAIDLGSQAALLVQPSARSFDEFSDRLNKSSQLYSVGGVGGVSQLRGGRIGNLTIGDETIDNPLVMVSRDFRSAPLPSYIEGLIGMEILSLFNLYIDYPAREIYLLRRN